MAEEELVVDDYQLINCISTGNFSQVWEVTEQGGTEHFAMKLLLPEALEEKDQVQVLKHEFKIGKGLEHPNLVRLQKLIATKKSVYMVMDYFRALNLKVQISTDRVGLQMRIKKMVEAICLALGYMHEKGLVHKDVKPDNILMNKSSELRLIDYSLTGKYAKGISKVFAGKIKIIQGTRTYIAPETVRKRPATPQTDMYSLGVTLFEILTGQPPFTGMTPSDLLKKHIGAIPPNPSDLNPNVTPEMDRLVRKLMEKKPEKRHQAMNEIYSEIRSLEVFKENVAEIEAERKRKVEEEEKIALAEMNKLDSRADAQRKELGLPSPPRRKKKKLPVEATKPQPKKQPAAQPAPQPTMPAPQMPVAYQQPGMPPQMPMQPPQMPMQPMPMPQQPFPQQPMPGYPAAPVAPQPYPQQPMPQMPQQPVPPQQMPQQPMPAQQMPQQPGPPQQMPQQPAAPPAQVPPAPAPVPQQPVPQPAPRSPVPAQAASPQPQPKPTAPKTPAPDKPKKSDDDLPLMEELPDIF